jgi:hypothetical protein
MTNDAALEIIASCLCALQNGPDGWSSLSPWGKSMWIGAAGQFAEELAARGWVCVPNPGDPPL